MKSKIIGLAAASLLWTSGAAVAQEHWTEGPVWECSSYRTNPGQFDTYLNWIRAHSEPINAEAKKQGLILDFKTFVKPPRDAHDYDVLFCTLHSSFGKALDYNKGDDDKQAQMASPRLEMRKYLGTDYVREVTLRPAK
jgi:hypothetical protein